MKQIVIGGKKLRELKDRYKDSLKLWKNDDLTEWGKGELNVLDIIFENVKP